MKFNLIIIFTKAIYLNQNKIIKIYCIFTIKKQDSHYIFKNLSFFVISYHILDPQSFHIINLSNFFI